MNKVFKKVLCFLMALSLIAVPVVPAKAAEANVKNLKVGESFVAEKCSASSFRVLSGDESVISKKEVEVNYDWALEFTAVKEGTVTFEVEQEIKYNWTRVTYTVNVGGGSEVKPQPEPTYPTVEVALNVKDTKTIANIKAVKSNSEKKVASAKIKKTGRGKRQKVNLVITALAEGETDITAVTKAGETKVFHVVVTDPNKPVVPDVPVDPQPEDKVVKTLKVGEYFDIEEAYASGFTCISGDESILEKSLVEVNSHNNLRLTAVKEGTVEFTQKHEVKGDWITTTYVVTVERKAEPQPEPQPQPEPTIPTEEVKLNIYDNTKIANVDKIVSNSASDVVEARVVKTGRWIKRSNLVLEGLKVGEADVVVVMKDGTDKNFHVVVVDPNAVKPDDKPVVPENNKVVKTLKVGEYFDIEEAYKSGFTYVSGDESILKKSQVEANSHNNLRLTAVKEGTLTFTQKQEIKGEWVKVTYEVTVVADTKPEVPEVKPDEKPEVKPDEKPEVKPDEKPDANTVVKNIKVGESFEMEKCNLNSLKVVSGDPASYKMEEVEIKWDWGYKFTALKEGTVKFTVEQEINWEWTPMTYIVNITK